MIPDFVIVLIIVLSMIGTISIIGNKRHTTVSNRFKMAQDSICILKDSISNLLEFSPENVLMLLEFYDVKEKDIVFNQVKLETGNFKSAVFKENNNLFGMKHPMIRPTTSIESALGHAYYNSYIESIKDYKLYQQRYYNGGDYYQFLINYQYSTDANYINKLRSFNMIHKNVK